LLASLAIGASHQGVRPDEQRPLAPAGKVNLADAYRLGRFEWNRRTREGSLKAIEFFEQAIDSDPKYAPAYSGMSDTYRFLDLQGSAEPAWSRPKAERAAEYALELDGSLAEARASMAGVLHRLRWNWAAAEYLRTIQLNPNYAEGRRAYAVFLCT
jgi:Tfp pilus assembly protein PilF